MLAVVFVARLVMGIQFQSIGSLGPRIIADLDLSYAQLGWLIGLYSLPGLVIAGPAGWLGGRWGEKRVAVGALALMTVGALVTAVSHEFTLACIGRVLSGIGSIVVNTVFAKMVSDWFRGKEIATAMAVMLTAWPAGIGLSLVSLSALATTTSWRAGLFATAAYAALALVLVGALYRRPAGPSDASATRGARLTRDEIVLSTLGGITWGGFNAAFLVFVGFAPALLVAHGASSAAAAATVSLTLWMSIVTIPLGGFIGDRVGRRDAAIIMGSVASAACIAALPLTSSSLAWCAGLAIVFALMPGAIMSLLPVRIRPEVLATAFGVFYSIYYAFIAVAQPIAGMLRDLTGGAAPPVFFAAALMIVTGTTHLAFIAARRQRTAAI